MLLLLLLLQATMPLLSVSGVGSVLLQILLEWVRRLHEIGRWLLLIQAVGKLILTSQITTVLLLQGV